MKILITANIDDENRRRLEEDLGAELDYRPISERDARLPEQELIDALEGVDVFVVGYEGISETVLDSADQLKIVACARGGPDANVDISAASERGIPVLYTPRRNAVSVADFTLGMMLAAARNIAHSHHLLHVGSYTGEPVADAASGGEREDVTWGISDGSPYVELKGPELRGKTIGIVGFGAIGRKVAQRARGFNVEMVAFDPFVDGDQMPSDVRKVGLEELCQRSDVVTVHCPVTDATRGLIGADEFEMMKQKAFFINTARGAIIDQDALIEQLESGGLRGAAIDVYDVEPLPDDHPLLALDNVVTTPHLAGAAEEVVQRHSKMLVDDITAMYEGSTPEHVADDSVLSISGPTGGGR